MSDQTVYAGIARPKLLTCDLSNLKTKVFNDTDDVSFVDVLMAATAAPTFFPAVKIGSTFFCDGGIAENHPGLEVAQDLRNVEYVATIGTGMAPMNYQHLHNAGLLHWAPCFVDVFVDSSQTAADDVLRAVFGDERSDLINLTLPPVKMNLDDPSTIPVLVDLAADYVQDSKEVFAQIADKLHRTVTHGSSTGQRRSGGGGGVGGGSGGGGSQGGDDEPETPY
jgi:predicted acylesterase/phospholipase RssA